MNIILAQAKWKAQRQSWLVLAAAADDDDRQCQLLLSDGPPNGTLPD